MDEQHARRIAQLQKAYEAGILDEDTYRDALAGIRGVVSHTATADKGVVAQDESIALDDRALHVGENVQGHAVTGDNVVIVEEGGTYIVRQEAEPKEVVDRETAPGRYLEYVIARNRYLQLQGIRSGGRLVHIELEQIYITLRASQQRQVSDEERWLAQEAAAAPGERKRQRDGSNITETVTLSIDEALANHRRLVVLGDPGSGKTTLLRYLALVYGRALDQDTDLLQERLGLPEKGVLPIFLSLRQLGAFVQGHAEESIEGHRLLLDFLHAHLHNERIEVPLSFFDPYLEAGEAIIMLDGLDEVAEPRLRRRVARLVESFTRAYPRCRFVVTSRIVGYTGAARLGEDYALSTVRDFTLEDVQQFLTHWHRLVAMGQMKAAQPAESYAAQQTSQLMDAIRGNERIRELAINPLILTVIALVHRDRVKLPDRRAELYAEAVEVLLGKWDEAKGLPTERAILQDRPFDTGDKRLMLQSVALYMHEAQMKEIEAAALKELLLTQFDATALDERAGERAAERFLQVIKERTGLLSERGEGTFSFSHLTFQEYLAALAVAGRDDYVPYTLARSHDTWWREVILLEAGYLSTQSKERTARLIQAIAENDREPAHYHNLVLAADCLRDVGSSRVPGALDEAIKSRLQAEFRPQKQSGWQRIWQSLAGQREALLERRIAAATALAQIGGQQFWTLPYGEPEWVEIPAGEFIMGSSGDDPLSDDDERPQTKLHLDAFWISRVPVTNAQYALFIADMEHAPPDHWVDGRPPKELDSHPVVNVRWYDAIAYCQWLAEKSGKSITLPSEAQWEKAARGSADARVYPWGDSFSEMRCNSSELDLGRTTPAGIFPDGASPYGLLDMSGNVDEWTRSLLAGYPYDPDDGREALQEVDDHSRFVVRGGSFLDDSRWPRCAFRDWDFPSRLELPPRISSGGVPIAHL